MRLVALRKRDEFAAAGARRADDSALLVCHAALHAGRRDGGTPAPLEHDGVSQAGRRGRWSFLTVATTSHEAAAQEENDSDLKQARHVGRGLTWLASFAATLPSPSWVKLVTQARHVGFMKLSSLLTRTVLLSPLLSASSVADKPSLSTAGTTEWR